MQDRAKLTAALRLQVEAGADEAIGDAPIDRYHQATEPAAAQDTAKPAAPAVRQGSMFGDPAPAKALQSTSAVADEAREQAAAATTLEALRAAVEAFDGCPIKATATNTVFGDGNPDGRVMVVGEAPGADEDRQGLPFVGMSGRLLDRMLACIDLDRTSFYITNILFWRPPGNRNPSAAEIAACLPFTERHIELVRPDILVFVGGASAKALLGRSEGIMRLRGRWFNFATPAMAEPIAAIATFHPAYLLRSPGQKREAWRDLLAIKAKLTA